MPLYKSFRTRPQYGNAARIKNLAIEQHGSSALWFALRHSERPIWLWPVVLALGWFAFEPLNFAFPLLGVADAVILSPLTLHALVKFIPNQIWSEYARLGGVNRDRRSA